MELERQQMGTFQDAVRNRYEERGYSFNFTLLGLGLCEEAGEICAAILDLHPEFKAKEGRVRSSLRYELHDCLVYLCAIANSAEIDLGI